ncbi:MAG: hypothetical protein ACPGUD_14780 [Parashewanella sp.]
MSDTADQAQTLEQHNIEQALQKRNKELPFTGACHYCDEPINKGHFCDADCRDDHQQVNRGYV